MAKAPKFAELNKIAEDLLVARLKASRAAIEHSGEKGRALEHQAVSLLRSFLPGEYGLSTGFIIYHTDDGPQLSTQQDIIIYDALRLGPVLRLETSDVFPLEAVYGCVEVKASLTSHKEIPKEYKANSVEALMRRSTIFRRMKIRKYWLPKFTTSKEPGIALSEVQTIAWREPYFYIFAFELDGPAGDIPALAQKMANESQLIGSDCRVDGLFIANTGFLYSRVVDLETATPADIHSFKYTLDHPLAAFKRRLLHDLNLFPRPALVWTPAIDQYEDVKINFATVAPGAA